MQTLAKLISEAVRTTAEKERAFASCEYDASWYCHRQIEAESEASAALEEGIREIVREEIARAKMTTA